ncbi:hypothetical protein Sjap_016905 [Stephania japonica]|uniref:Uncharacterized protein n=1 Tax=Stephania japonica TaxID=461633 RepID=A0AAP0I553_9MAGN
MCKHKVRLNKKSDKTLYQDLEHAFLKIISTLPMSDSKKFLHRCLSFCAHEMEDNSHLVSTSNLSTSRFSSFKCSYLYLKL